MKLLFMIVETLLESIENGACVHLVTSFVVHSTKVYSVKVTILLAYMT